MSGRPTITTSYNNRTIPSAVWDAVNYTWDECTFTWDTSISETLYNTN